MHRAVGLAFVAVAVLLIILGINASQGLTSRFSETFSGTPSNRALWLLIGGAASGVVGLILTFKSRHLHH
jgi:hypothetical protein